MSKFRCDVCETESDVVPPHLFQVALSVGRVNRELDPHSKHQLRSCNECFEQIVIGRTGSLTAQSIAICATFGVLKSLRDDVRNKAGDRQRELEAVYGTPAAEDRSWPITST